MLRGAFGFAPIPQQLRAKPARFELAATVEMDSESEFTTRLALVEALRGVLVDDGDVVSSGLVGGVSVSFDALQVELELPRGNFDEEKAGDLASQCEAAASATRDALAAEGVVSEECAVDVSAHIGRREQEEVVEVPPEKESLRRVKRVVAVSSCKGGVGKSTVATNLAFGLASRGHKVGIVDTDVHGPSLPTLVGEPDVPSRGEPYVRLAAETDEWNRELLEPLEKAGVKMMSFGFLNDAPAMMRGSRVAGVVQQLATSVAWRDLDFLVVDMPPGTGDAQLTLCQELTIDAAVVVTTPSKLAFADVVKGVKLFDEVSVPVVAVVENMAAFQPPTEAARDKAHAFVQKHQLDETLVDELSHLLSESHRIFGQPHSRKLKEMWGIEHAFEMPLSRDVAETGDQGVPLYLAKDGSEQVTDTLKILDNLVDAVVLETTQNRLGNPPELSFDGENIIAVYNGETETVNPRTLRLACRCAACIDEETGKVNPGRMPVPQDVKPTKISKTGNYAASVAWSDGHQSLYPYKSFLASYSAAVAQAAPETN